jgi:2-polyprenyl-3-methyl-5-hydroxy-6-metoxy-1,4-benzoquinol methylase
MKECSRAPTMLSEYSRAYRDLYRLHWWWRAREEFLVSVIQQHIPLGRPHRILDVGCGGGLFFERLAAFGEVYGVETDITMKTGTAEIDDRIFWGSIEAFRPSAPYSVILLLDVLEHLRDPIRTLRCALDMLEPGGFFLATVPAFPLLWTHHDEVNEHVVRYTKRTFAEVLEAAGARLKMMQYFFHWTFPAKLAVRVAEAVLPRRPLKHELPSVPPAPVNRALYLLSRLEQVCLRGAIPFGSSLLAIGQADRAEPERRQMADGLSRPGTMKLALSAAKKHLGVR